ncbi:hypothetical protein IIC65_08545, partial [Candidatus Sumerlaeota bacterium]|nr:hypothetical protein [Candidatus Sumerlaeota bacterium]
MANEKLMLDENWTLQSETKIEADGAALSGPEYAAEGWYPISVPTTVMAALVDGGVYPDPYYGENLTSIPGYKEGRWLVMPEDSPFRPSWWYRTHFLAPEEFAGKILFLHFDGINYKANIWLNGERIASSDEVVGMFRRFEFDVSDSIRAGRENFLAVEIIAPGKLPDRNYRTKQVEATTGWDDHNPQPPDMNMGIWEGVYLGATGPVRLDHPHVSTALDLPSLDGARITVSAELTNHGDEPITAELEARIEDIVVRQSLSLEPGETRLVVFSPDTFEALNVKAPRVWWPVPIGRPELYDLDLTVSAGGETSDTDRVRFGIREITSTINDEGWRVYHVNGKNMLIRGGAWMTSDMMLNLSERRYRALIRYAKEANLNMLRSEGFSIRETDEFYDLCDEYGVMVTQQLFGRSIPEEWLAIEVVKDTILRIRNHPSLAHFLGHDETFPTETLDSAYRDLIATYVPDRTYQPHSGAFNVEDRFETGGTRTGTRELWTYAMPSHYYLRKNDGAWGFAQSGGIGGVVASMESLRKMIPEEELWP